MTKVFITGIGGLLGSTLAKTLLIKGTHEIAGCDTFIGGLKDNVPENVEFFNTDILDYEADNSSDLDGKHRNLIRGR